MTLNLYWHGQLRAMGGGRWKPTAATLHRRLGEADNSTYVFRCFFDLQQVDRKRHEDQKRAAAAALPVMGPDGVVSRGGAAGGAGEDVRAFARRQGMDADIRDGDSVMAWGILEGDPEKVSGRFASFVARVFCCWAWMVWSFGGPRGPWRWTRLPKLLKQL